VWAGGEEEEEPCPEDKCVKAMLTATEEGKKVERSGSRKHYCVYRRLQVEEIAEFTKETFFTGGSSNKD